MLYIVINIILQLNPLSNIQLCIKISLNFKLFPKKWDSIYCKTVHLKLISRTYILDSLTASDMITLLK